LSNTNLSDEQLIQSISEGEDKAFEELYNRYEGKLMGFLVYKVKSNEAAQDLFQIVWSKVVQNSHKFKQDHNFSSWLMTIASNQVKDWFKTSTNYSKLIERFGNEPTTHDDIEKSLPNLSFLKQESQEILILRYVQGLTSGEVAKKLNLTEANVRKITSRALKEVKAHIQNGGSI
jgi:RNA polymerase sigma-70 factor (ECF subfamily)